MPSPAGGVCGGAGEVWTWRRILNSLLFAAVPRSGLRHRIVAVLHTMGSTAGSRARGDPRRQPRSPHPDPECSSAASPLWRGGVARGWSQHGPTVAFWTRRCSFSSSRHLRAAPVICSSRVDLDLVDHHPFPSSSARDWSPPPPFSTSFRGISFVLRTGTDPPVPQRRPDSRPAERGGRQRSCHRSRRSRRRRSLVGSRGSSASERP